jgi:hypothetical protein
MLATPQAEKRVPVLADILKARNFTANEITSFVEHWLTTQSKFPVLADIYAFSGKKIRKNHQCDGDGVAILQVDDYLNDEHLARLIFLNECLDRYEPTEKLCCFLYREYSCDFETINHIKNLINDGGYEIKSDFIVSETNLLRTRLINKGRKTNYFQIQNRDKDVKIYKFKENYASVVKGFTNERGCQD